MAVKAVQGIAPLFRQLVEAAQSMVAHPHLPHFFQLAQVQLQDKVVHHILLHHKAQELQLRHAPQAAKRQQNQQLLLAFGNVFSCHALFSSFPQVQQSPSNITV